MTSVIVREVTKEGLQEAMSKQQTILGSLRAQLQELQVRATQERTIATYSAASTSTAKQLLRTKMANTIVLPEGVLAAETETDKAAVGRITGLGLNLAALPRDTLYQLQDGITVELRAREGRTIQVMNEKNINIEQLNLQHDELVSQNHQIVQTVDEACRRVPELSIIKYLPTEMQIHYLSSGF